MKRYIALAAVLLAFIAADVTYGGQRRRAPARVYAGYRLSSRVAVRYMDLGRVPRRPSFRPPQRPGRPIFRQARPARMWPRRP